MAADPNPQAPARPTAGGRLAVLPARAFDDRRLSRPARDVLGVLSTYADRDGWCWPKVTSLAERLDLARTTVSGHLQRLVTLGYLEIRARHAADGRQLANAYRILYDADLTTDDDRQHHPATPAGEQPSTHNPSEDLAGNPTDVAGHAGEASPGHAHDQALTAAHPKASPNHHPGAAGETAGPAAAAAGRQGGVSAQPTGSVGSGPTPPVGSGPTPRTPQENDSTLSRAHTPQQPTPPHPQPPTAGGATPPRPAGRRAPAPGVGPGNGSGAHGATPGAGERDPAGLARRLLDSYLASLATPLPRRFVGKLRATLTRLAAEGYDEPTLTAALGLRHRRGLDPEALDSLVAQALTADPPGQRHTPSGLPGATPEQLRARAAQLRNQPPPPAPGPGPGPPPPPSPAAAPPTP